VVVVRAVIQRVVEAHARDSVEEMHCSSVWVQKAVCEDVRTAE